MPARGRSTTPAYIGPVKWIPQNERNADLSPDRLWLAYESNQSGQYEVWVRPFPSVEDGEYQVSSGGGMWPLWNPEDGHELFYVGPQGMMAVAVDTDPTFSNGTPEVLFDTAGYGTPLTVGDNRRVDISPDGKRFLMFKATAGGGPEITVILNWAEELKRLVPVP